MQEEIPGYYIRLCSIVGFENGTGIPERLEDIINHHNHIFQDIVLQFVHQTTEYWELKTIDLT